MLTSIRHIANDLITILFPNLCVNCLKSEPFQGEQFCLSCLSKIPFIEDQKAVEASLIGKKSLPKDLSSQFALMYYYKKSISQNILHEIKYKDNPRLAQALGEELARRYLKRWPKDAILVPVPLHPKRRYKRGYNQAKKIAEGISKVTQLPIDDRIIKRVLNNTSQTQKSLEERKELLKDTYAIRKKVNYEKVILVDDVVTTGATISACYNLLKSIDIGEVHLATVAITV